MPFRAEDYDFFVFDCDGVILDSNAIKSRAFYDVALPFGTEKAERFVEYHELRGGISRQEKFKYFVAEILETEINGRAKLESKLVEAYGRVCQEGLAECSLISGIRKFLASLPNKTRNYVVSGGAQAEVRQILKERQLDRFFLLILGNPSSKEENMQQLFEAGSFSGRGGYFGDARLDMELAQHFGLEFVFVSDASEWAAAAVELSGPQIHNFDDLLDQI